MKVHQTLEWLNLLSLGTKGLKPHQQSVYNQNLLQMTTHYCAILTLSHQGAGCNCILSVSRRCVWCAARQGKESRLLLVAFPSPSPIGGEKSDVSTLYSYVVWRHSGTAAGHTPYTQTGTGPAGWQVLLTQTAGRGGGRLNCMYMYFVRPARMRSSVPLLEPGPPRFFWWYENSE